MSSNLTRWAVRHTWAYSLVLLAGWAVLVTGAVQRWWRPSGAWAFLLFVSVVSALLVGAWARWRRERFLREAPMPQFLKRKLRQVYPHLTQKDAELVERGLRQFFLACHRSPRKFVAMPSRVVDAMWHEFILHTQAYRDWCALVLGRFLHHTPAEVLGARAEHNDGLRRAWYWSCKDEAIDPRTPTRLPLLFALDTKLEIPNGFRYAPDCKTLDGRARSEDGAGFVHCATSFGDGSASGDGADFGGAEGDAGGDGGDGGGCGGGCGGGGD